MALLFDDAGAVSFSFGNSATKLPFLDEVRSTVFIFSWKFSVSVFTDSKDFFSALVSDEQGPVHPVVPLPWGWMISVFPAFGDSFAAT